MLVTMARAMAMAMAITMDGGDNDGNVDAEGVLEWCKVGTETMHVYYW